MKKLSDYLPTINDSIFSAFNNPIWATAFQNSSELDTYFYLRYGDRIGNKLIDNYADEDTGIVDSTNLIHLASLVYSINSKKWEHLYKVYTSEYNPIENTDFIETITDTNSNTKVIDSDGTSSGTATTNSNATNTGSTSGDNNVFGFNSTNAVGDTTSSGSNTDQTYANSSTTTSGSTTDDSTITDNGTHTSEHRKHGNIGVTENVTMLEHEVAFWKWSFIDQVCKDICDIIALSIY